MLISPLIQKNGIHQKKTKWEFAKLNGACCVPNNFSISLFFFFPLSFCESFTTFSKFFQHFHSMSYIWWRVYAQIVFFILNNITWRMLKKKNSHLLYWSWLKSCFVEVFKEMDVTINEGTGGGCKYHDKSA